MGMKKLFKEEKIKPIKLKRNKEFTPDKIIKLGVTLGTTVVAVAVTKKLLE